MQTYYYDFFDMIYMLSQINGKVPLSKRYRIEEHKSKALSSLGGIGNNNIIERESSLGKEVQLVVKEKDEK